MRLSRLRAYAQAYRLQRSPAALPLYLLACEEVLSELVALHRAKDDPDQQAEYQRLRDAAWEDAYALLGVKP